MGRWFLVPLGITAVAAATALFFPHAIVLGLFLGILPGIFLSVAPSLFVYLLAWWAARWIVFRVWTLAGFDPATRPGTWAANLVTLVIVLLPAIIVPQAINASLEPRIEELQASDVQADSAIEFPGTVAVELPETAFEKVAYCEEICLRLLYNHTVSRVIAAYLSRDGEVTLANGYRVERRAECPKMEFSRRSIIWPGEWQRVNGKFVGLLDRVRARIAAGECLVREEGKPEDAQLVISLREVKRGADRFRGPWKLWLDTLSARRLEMTASDGHIIFRRTEVTTQPLAVPLRHVVAAGFLTTVTYSGWLRISREASPLGPNARDVLPALLGDAVRLPDMPVASDPG